MPRVVIAGCGFVGLTAANAFHTRGFEVVGLTRSVESAAKLKDEPFAVFGCDIADLQALESIGEARADIVIHCASSNRGGADEYRNVYLAGVKNLAAVFRPERFIFTSSTSVYAQRNGEWVTEESATEPQRETGCILLEAETFVLAGGGIVARLAGIYGPGRSVLLQRFFSGSASIEENGSRWINQAHRDDIVSALLKLAGQNKGGVFNVTDNEPLTQRTIYEWLAERFERPTPGTAPVDPNRKRGWTNKRVSNAKLRSLGWEPRYPSFFTAVTNDADLLRLIKK